MDHVSPSSFSSRRRQVSSIDASLPPSSYRHRVLPIQTPEISESPVVSEASVPTPIDDAYESMSPPNIDLVESVPPPDGEADEDAKLESFEGGHVELSCLYTQTILLDVYETAR